MRYLLCHKESPVLSFEPDENYSSLKVLEVFDRKFVPVGINKENYNDISDEIDNAKFLNWWKNRAIPTGRKNIEKALEILNVSSIEELLPTNTGPKKRMMIPAGARSITSTMILMI